nr:uncharacterized protein LOC132763592 [Anolis sagrei ordinatus]
MHPKDEQWLGPKFAGEARAQNQRKKWQEWAESTGESVQSEGEAAFQRARRHPMGAGRRGSQHARLKNLKYSRWTEGNAEGRSRERERGARAAAIVGKQSGGRGNPAKVWSHAAGARGSRRGGPGHCWKGHGGHGVAPGHEEEEEEEEEAAPPRTPQPRSHETRVLLQSGSAAQVVLLSLRMTHRKRLCSMPQANVQYGETKPAETHQNALSFADSHSVIQQSSGFSALLGRKLPGVPLKESFCRFSSPRDQKGFTKLAILFNLYSLHFDPVKTHIWCLNKTGSL